MTADPTAIPIEFDPREQRMRGTAVHGNTPFDVPFVAGLALVLDGMAPAEAIDLLREKRSPAVLCNPTFAAFLSEWEDDRG